jgi:L-rhamnose mutarotase
MPRHAFKLRLKAGAGEEYDRAHANVWPELLGKLMQVGISNYSVFRRGQELFLVMEVEDFDRAWDALAKDPVNQRWQKEMGRLFEPVPDQQPGERFAMMKEVFHLE